MNQKMKRATVLGIGIFLSLAQSCTNSYSTTAPPSVFNRAGKITSVDIVKKDMYVDTSIRNKGADICIVNAFTDGDELPLVKDSVFFHVDTLTNTIDTFVIKRKQ